MTLLTTMTNGMETMNLEAFRCDSPVNLQDFQVVTHNESCGRLPMQRDPLQRYAIVQKRSYNKAAGFKCTKRVSRFTFICTSNALAAHQRLAAIPEIELPQDMARDDCHSLVTDEEYEGPDGARHKVPLGKTTVLRFHEAGREEVSGQTVVCEGEQVKLGNRVIQGVAVLTQVKFHTQAMTFRMDATTATVEVKEDHRILPCTAFYHFCVTSEGTYLWEEADTTRFQKVRVFSGQLTMEENQEVLISTEQKLRLVLGQTERYEGRDYRKTKYSNIYVVNGEAEYMDTFPSDHLRLTAWIAARDDYITWSMEQKILQAYQVMADTSCRRRKDLLHTQMATSFSNPHGSHHLHLGENLFGALVGETLYTYQCQTVKVTPREETRCTKELPVVWEEHNYYLEPVSRLLKKYGNPVPCSHLMPNKFRTEDGRWIAATPELMVTQAPKEVTEIEGNLNLTHVDMSEGGLYTNQQLAEFTKLLEYPRAKALVANSIYREACHDNHEEVCVSFTEILGPVKEDPTNLFKLRSRVILFLHNFGEAAASLIAIYILGLGLKWLVDTMVACITLRHVAGRRRWWQPLIPLKWVVSYDYGRASSQARKQQREEQQERAAEMQHLQRQEGHHQHVPIDEEQDRRLLDELQKDEGFDSTEKI